MDIPGEDPTHKIEVRTYSRQIAGMVELFFVDHDGRERVVAQWRLSPNELAQQVAEAKAAAAAAAPPVDEDLARALEADRFAVRLRQETPDRLRQALAAAAAPEDLEHGLSLANLGARDPDTPKMHAPAPPSPPPPAKAPPPPEVPLDDTSRRRAAKARIRRAVAEESRNTLDQQMRYELAMQAHNGNTNALELFELEAKAAGITVRELITRVLNDRRTRERRMMQVRAIQAHALKELDKAGGEAIGELEARTVAEITGDDNGHNTPIGS